MTYRVLLIAALLLPPPPVAAQSVLGARKAFATSHDTATAHRMSLAVPRILYGTAVGAALALPTAYVAGASESSALVYVAGGAYIAGIALGQSGFGANQSCSRDARFWRSLAGTFVGAVVGGGIAAGIHGRKDLPLLATLLFGGLGPPVGGAWALWTCD